MNSKSSRKKRDKRKGGTSTESKEITMRVGHGNMCVLIMEFILGGLNHLSYLRQFEARLSAEVEIEGEEYGKRL